MNMDKLKVCSFWVIGTGSFILICWFLSYNSSHSVNKRAWNALPVHVQQERTAEKHRKARVYQTLKFQFEMECIETISQFGDVSGDAIEECRDLAWRNAEKIVKLGLEKNYDR